MIKNEGKRTRKSKGSNWQEICLLEKEFADTVRQQHTYSHSSQFSMLKRNRLSIALCANPVIHTQNKFP